MPYVPTFILLLFLSTFVRCNTATGKRKRDTLQPSEPSSTGRRTQASTEINPNKTTTVSNERDSTDLPDYWNPTLVPGLNIGYHCRGCSKNVMINHGFPSNKDFFRDSDVVLGNKCPDTSCKEKLLQSKILGFYFKSPCSFYIEGILYDNNDTEFKSKKYDIHSKYKIYPIEFEWAKFDIYVKRI